MRDKDRRKIEDIFEASLEIEFEESSSNNPF